jgi:hypothetical protein
MPKSKPSKVCHLRQIVSKFDEHIFSTDGSILFSKMCEVSVAAGKTFTVQQHIGRDKHILVHSVENASKKKSLVVLLTQSVSTSKSKSSDFYKDLCEVLVFLGTAHR